jgi:hypothetical protein
MRPKLVMAKRMRSFVRRCIYNRWFYAFLAGICTLDIICDIFDIAKPGAFPVLTLLSLVASGVAAFLALLIFIDLQSRRNKL